MSDEEVDDPRGRGLQVLGQLQEERADAARNRRRILEAAERLAAERGVGGLSMEEVASAAGVGVGTLYRRFESRAGLARALLDRRERRFQAAFLKGPPPLGPGASAVERIEAFLHAYVDYLEAATDLHLMAEAEPGARYQSGAYRAHHAHLALLLGQAFPDADVEYLADSLFAPLAVHLYTYQRVHRAMDPQRIKRGLSALVRGLERGGQ
jgi:AcrR family transcriptional regulator